MLKLYTIIVIVVIVRSAQIIKLSVRKNLKYDIFYGIGAISGGGATSKLLVSYPTEIKNQIYDYLFKPQFGASLHMLKVEIGGDTQSTEGTEASHMHTENDLNCQRGYEWEIILEAKKRNPDIFLYGLPWGFPGWVGKFTDNPFVNVEITSQYIIEWLKCARDVHGIDIDYIGTWNENHVPVQYITTLRKFLDNNNFKKVQIIGSDHGWDLAGFVLNTTDLRNYVYAIGAHYPGTRSSKNARDSKLPLWSSEDFSTENQYGEGCLARIINQNYVNGSMTSTIIWNLIASYYNNLPYPHCGLMTADSPWSGDYFVSKSLWVTAHTTQFAWPGWRYLSVESGASGKLLNGGSFVTLISQDLDNMTIVIETIEHHYAACVRPDLEPYFVSQSVVEIVIPEFIYNRHIDYYIWSTLVTSTDDMDIFKLEKIVHLNSNGIINLTVQPNYVITVTTVKTGQKGNYSHGHTPKEFPKYFYDDYENYSISNEPHYLTPQFGSFEIVADPTKPGNRALLQTVLNNSVTWCYERTKLNTPVAVIGNFNKNHLVVSVLVMMTNLNHTRGGAMLSSGINYGGCGTSSASGVYYWLDMVNSEAFITNDILGANIQFMNKTKKIKENVWYNMTLHREEHTTFIYLDSDFLGQVYDNNSLGLGFEGIGALEYQHVYYDNFELLYI